MKIGIVSSGVESFSLFRFLSKYNHEYVIYYDSLHAPYWSKFFDTSKKFVEEGILWLKKHWVEKIILPPIFELYFKEKYWDFILPIFSFYLSDYVFKYSLVWKLWLLWEYSDLQVAQSYIAKLSDDYKLSDNQLSIKSFSYPFNFWSKDGSLLNYLLWKLSWKSFLVNSVFKQELRYFKDAHVDTVIPLNYLYFNWEKTVKKFLNFKKIRFHWMDCIEDIFLKLVNLEWDNYSVDIYATDQKDLLLNDKRLLWMLQRWKEVSLNWL
jgi:hypothetical protein